MLQEPDDIASTHFEKPSGLWKVFRKLAFSFDAEHMHELAIKFLKLKSSFIHTDLPQSSVARSEVFLKRLLGLNFPNLVGLAAGFDVDAEAIPALQALGFGFIEVGGITEKAQAGNPKPRIFRIPNDSAIINRLNFFNKGAHNLRENLSRLRAKNRIFVPIGINLGKSNFVSIDETPQEYLKTFKIIHEVADYITINVSCPNTKDLQKYQTAASLATLLDTICNYNEQLSKPVPLFLKLGPDLANEEAIACADIALDYGLKGLVVANTTAKRGGLSSEVDYGPGGLSGRPLFERSTQLLRCISKDYQNKLVLIGCGGIMDGPAALAKINAGADLLQVYTGFVYGGPGFVFDLLEYLKPLVDGKN